MAQLIFKRGSLANLNNLAIKDGQFIVTTDEGALYVDNGSTRVRLGDFIVVENVAALPSAGANRKAMYYCESENVLARWNGTEWIQINKQPTTAELKVKLGLDAEGEVTAAIAAAKKAGDDAQADVDTLTEYVGTFTHDTAKTVVEYINAKTDGIATSGNLEALGQRVTTVEGKVATIEGDYLKGADKTELEGKITTAQTAADNAQQYAEGVAGDLADHEADAVAHVTAAEREAWDGKTTMAEVEAKNYLVAADIAGKANADDVYTKDDVDGMVETINDAIDLKAAADDVYNKTEIEGMVGALEDEDERLAGLIGDNASAIEAIANDYLKNDDKTALQGAIDAKADQTALDAEVQRATGVEGGFETRIKAIEDDYLKAADKTELQGNIDTLTGVVEALRDGVDAEKVDGVIDLINYVEEHGAEVTGMKEDIADNAQAIVDEAARAAEAEEALGGRIDTLSGVVEGKAAQADLEDLDGRVEVAEGKITTLEGEMDAVEGRATTLEGKVANLETASDTHATKDELQAVSDVAEAAVTVEEMNAAISAAGHASQTDLTAHIDDAVKHITADERTAWDKAITDLSDHKSAYDTKVAALEAEDAAIRSAFATADGALKTELQGYADQAEADAVAAAKTETESQVGAEKTAREKADANLQSAIDAINNAETGILAQAKSDATSKANAAEANAKSHAEGLMSWGEF